jgi:AAA+ superfamily predicted ATPase
MSRIVRYTILNLKKNEIKRDLQIIQKRLDVGRMSSDRIPKNVLNYQPKGFGRSLKQKKGFFSSMRNRSQ